MITIKRNKNFCGALVPYKIITNYDVNEYKELINKYSSIINENDINGEQNNEALKLAEKINKIPYLLIKNGEEIKIDNSKVNNIFICLNDDKNNSIYPFTYSNQLSVSDNKNYIIYTKFHWKGNELILKESD